MHRRSFLRGLFAAPAVVAVSSLMPIRGIVMPAFASWDPPQKMTVPRGLWEVVTGAILEPDRPWPWWPRLPSNHSTTAA